MSEEVFRMIVAVGVGIACIAFLMQAFVVIALYRVSKQLQQRVEPLAGRAEKTIDQLGPVIDQLAPLAQKAGPLVESIGPLIHKIGPVMEKVGPMCDKVGPMFDKIGPLFDKVGPVIEKVGPVIEKTGPVIDQARIGLENANRILEDLRPRVSAVSDEVVEIAKEGREQVGRLGDLLHDAGDRARNRLEQIDTTVEHTVEQVEHVGDAMKRAVMRPVAEVNGIAAGISAAMATLVKRPRKSSVDSATQDEEMFI